jgi:hypothetical protein
MQQIEGERRKKITNKQNPMLEAGPFLRGLRIVIWGLNKFGGCVKWMYVLKEKEKETEKE